MEYSYEVKANTKASDVKLAQSLLDDAAKRGLQGEVFVWALLEMQWRPKISVAEALTASREEWLK